jgi:hypothetical protein
VHFPPERRRVSRQLLTDLNVTQLQVVANDLHSLIESTSFVKISLYDTKAVTIFAFLGLNEALVQLLMDRDDLHMEQDSHLVDIEDLNRYL